MHIEISNKNVDFENNATYASNKFDGITYDGDQVEEIAYAVEKIFGVVLKCLKGW
jgi:hypothetical protein